jgi:hypothetical protein
MTLASLDDLAARLETSPDRVRDVVRRTLHRLPQRRYYVFRITGGSTTPAPSQPRMIAAFPTPDDALTFAQRNGYGSNAQLRSVGAIELIVRLLTEGSIGSVLFVRGGSDTPAKGFGPGLKLERAALLDQLQTGDQTTEAESTEPLELTAKRYDALQWGIEFADRARFRVALAEALEEVIDSYVPPPGSVDSGPRSIFAITAVEQWLREHGFPHAHQRQWIDVQGAPQWNGAVELCEIDGGTEHRLLIQIAIHADEHGRQYVKWVNVTT